MFFEEFIWDEKYRPSTLEECILPKRIKGALNAFVELGMAPNLLLYSPPGQGKTTAARALVGDLGANYIFLNASSNRGIDTLRSDIFNYASTVPLIGNRKYVILDEADNMTDAFQLAFRAFIAEFSKTVSFILTCNWPSKIIEPIRSRFTEIDFSIGNADWNEVGPLICKRLHETLKLENIECDSKAIPPFVKKHYPDIRKMLICMQAYTIENKKFDSGILTFRNNSLDDFFLALKEKNLKKCTEMVQSSNEYYGEGFYSQLFELRNQYIEPASIPKFILILSEYQDKETRVANKVINTLALFVTLSSNLKFKQ